MGGEEVKTAVTTLFKDDDSDKEEDRNAYLKLVLERKMARKPIAKARQQQINTTKPIHVLLGATVTKKPEEKSNDPAAPAEEKKDMLVLPPLPKRSASDDFLFTSLQPMNPMNKRKKSKKQKEPALSEDQYKGPPELTEEEAASIRRLVHVFDPETTGKIPPEKLKATCCYLENLINTFCTKKLREEFLRNAVFADDSDLEAEINGKDIEESAGEEEDPELNEFDKDDGFYCEDDVIEYREGYGPDGKRKKRQQQQKGKKIVKKKKVYSPSDEENEEKKKEEASKEQEAVKGFPKGTLQEALQNQESLQNTSQQVKEVVKDDSKKSSKKDSKQESKKEKPKKQKLPRPEIILPPSEDEEDEELEEGNEGDDDDADEELDDDDDDDLD